MKQLGHKKITTKNWNEPDHPSTAFIKEIKNGKVIHWTGEDWVEAIMKPELSEKVPLEIRKLYEVARGAMIYGFLFYPLYTLADEQFYRIVDSASVMKCKELCPDKNIRNFKKRIEYLCEKKIINVKEKQRWNAIRNLRNARSHPEYQMIIDPGNALETLKLITEMINSIYR